MTVVGVPRLGQRWQESLAVLVAQPLGGALAPKRAGFGQREPKGWLPGAAGCRRGR
ncbi:hypothetical protein [Mycobacterium riyadhense]|uniref:hypothetical protein n=1 Tax=Mycobacterium riyadhense TaxID=486698 RepID=UPI00194FBBC8|nr:hypothetical protein [Mycobacterium riyadhense]